MVLKSLSFLKCLERDRHFTRKLQFIKELPIRQSLLQPHIPLTLFTPFPLVKSLNQTFQVPKGSTYFISFGLGSPNRRELR